MQNDLTESVQTSIRPGDMTDTYYYGDSNTEKQAYPAVVNTRFVQNFTQLGAGSSQFVISPNMGVSDIVCAFQTPASTGSNYTLLALKNLRRAAPLVAATSKITTKDAALALGLKQLLRSICEQKTVAAEDRLAAISRLLN